MDYQPPDLATVLRTLAQFAPPAIDISPIQQPSSTAPFATELNRKIEEDYEPPEAETSAYNAPIPSQKRQNMPLQAHVPIKSVPPVDPATITDWPNGLRHVMKAVARNEAIAHRIRKVRGY